MNLELRERHTVILFWLFLWVLEGMAHCFGLWGSFPGNLIPSVTPLRGGAFKVGKKRKPLWMKEDPEWVYTVGGEWWGRQLRLSLSSHSGSLFDVFCPVMM